MKDRVRETLVQGKQTLVTPGEAGEGCGLFVILCNSNKGSLDDLDNHIVLAHTGDWGLSRLLLARPINGSPMDPADQANQPEPTNAPAEPAGPPRPYIAGSGSFTDITRDKPPSPEQK